jgi:hypothetical protein
MAEKFELIWLEKEYLELVELIKKKVVGIVSIEDALRWALRQSTRQFVAVAQAINEKAVPIEEPILNPEDHLKLGEHADIALHIPLGTHRELLSYMTRDLHVSSLIDLARNAVQLDHTVSITPGTLARLVPDKAARIKLFDPDKL